MLILECIDGSLVAAESQGEYPCSGGADGRATRAMDKRLCIRTVLCGTERLEHAHRTIRLDEDSYLIQNSLESIVGPGRSEDRLVALVFTPSQIARALGAGELPVFREHVRLKVDQVGTHLRSIEGAVQAGNAMPAWLDEQFVVLLISLLRAEQELDERAFRINCVKAVTRQELLRRLLLATDFIHSHYEQPLQLEAIAQAARLSRFHLVRLFRQVLGVTPHAFLLNKRLSVARRLLTKCDGDLNHIALHSGFGNRWSLFRRLQAQHGVGGQALRDARAARPTSGDHASA